MKTTLCIAVLSSLCFFSCKKEIVFTEANKGFIRAELNGETNNYYLNAKAFRDSANGLQLVAYKKEASNFESLFMFKIIDNKPIAPGTYIENNTSFPKITVSHVVELLPGYYGNAQNVKPYNSSMPARITITELTATMVKGTIEGDLFVSYPNNYGGYVELLRNGTFEIKP
jgi:hypothetical protein